MFDIARQNKEIAELQSEMQKPDFWKNKERAIQFSQKLSELKEKTESFEALKRELSELLELKKIVEKGESSQKDVASRIQTLKKEIDREEKEIFFSGKYDRNPAILSIYAGAGGKDAQDWATMLLRMYEKYLLSKGFKVTVLHQSFGEGGGPEGRIGTKSVTLEVRGRFAYGYLKGEAGVHRLVRISPFSAKSLRHTSFALVEVLPELGEDIQKEIEINPKDLKLEVFRASGPGGQYVNRRESAVRITHLPTGITVACQSERLQGANRKKAMDLLYAKLYQLKRRAQEKELKKLKGKSVSIEWGNQVRSYVLHPYKLVKDLRTGTETTDVESVLDGKLDDFIASEIKSLHYD